MSGEFLKWIFLAACLGLGAILSAQTDQHHGWNRGAVVVGPVSGIFQLNEIGGETLDASAFEAPRYFSGQIRIRAEERGGVFLRGSNGLALRSEGPGFFAVERFEQMGLPAEDAEPEVSRTILNLREGVVIVDGRGSGMGSQLILESPLGRVTSDAAWWMMRIGYDERSRIYNFSIECADGRIRFVDRRGDAYTLRAGQRLSGAGGSGSPSIEVAEVSGEATDFFDRFAAEAEAFPLSAVDPEAMREKMRLPAAESGAAGALASEYDPKGTGKRPLIIEYAPRSEPVTPYRGVLRAPGRHEAEAF